MRGLQRVAVAVALFFVLFGPGRAEVLDVNDDGLVGPDEVLELVRLWRQEAISVEDAATAWSLTGNAGTTAGTHFLGTIDDQALELRVNGKAALRLRPDADSPSLIGGHSSNLVLDGVVGAVISGGGNLGSHNGVNDDFGTVGGGSLNYAGRSTGSTFDQSHATVSGGSGNRAYGKDSTVGGGYGNLAEGQGATVGGGDHNSATDECSTVSGGRANQAVGLYGTVSGGNENAAEGSNSTVAGGRSNRASGFRSTVGGGYDNQASGQGSTAVGGEVNLAAGRCSVVCGGNANEAGGNYSFAAGNLAKAHHEGSFVWSDYSGSDFGSSGNNQFLIRAVGGVGIGTALPDAQLHVAENVSGGAGIANHVAAIENTSIDSSPDVLALKMNIQTPNDANNYITFMNSEGNIGSIEGNGSGGVVFTTTGGDFAEYLPVFEGEEIPEPGDVVGLFGSSVSRRTVGAQRALIVSTAPAVLGNCPAEQGQPHAPVAFIGQVQVRVHGAIRAGEAIVSSGKNDGTGRASSTADTPSSIAGYAIESSSDEGVKLVRALVGFPHDPSSLTESKPEDDKIASLERQIEEMRAQIESLNRSLMELRQGPNDSFALHRPQN